MRPFGETEMSPHPLTIQADALAATPEAVAVRAAWGLASESDMDELVKAYVVKAQAMGTDPLAWSVFASPHPAISGDHSTLSLFVLLMGGPRCIKGLSRLMDAGASPWLSQCASPLVWTQPINILHYAFGQSHLGDHGSHKKCLKVAAEAALAARAHGAPVEQFVAIVVANYDELTKNSSKTAKGVLGPADKLARDVADALVFCEHPLRALALATCAAPELDLALRNAKERLAAKNDRAGALVSPQKVKKALTPEQIQRMEALRTLCSQYSGDEELIAAAFAVSGWLGRAPMAPGLCSAKQESLVHAALSSGSSAALRGLESIGANLWFAAAQSGHPNPCVWAVNLMDAHPSNDLDLAPLARMLLAGAWLDGSPDANARARAAASEARDLFDHFPRSISARRIEVICAFLEKHALDDATSPGAPVARPKSL